MADDDDPVWVVGEGETLFADARCTLKRLSADYVSRTEGVLLAGVPGRGEVPLAELLAEERTAVRPDSSGTVVTLKPRKP